MTPHVKIYAQIFTCGRLSKPLMPLHATYGESGVNGVSVPQDATFATPVYKTGVEVA